MAETWVRPPLLGLERPPAWQAAWRFRLVMAVLMVVLVFLFYGLYRELSGANAQDPGLTELPPVAPVPTPVVTVPQLPTSVDGGS